MPDKYKFFGSNHPEAVPQHILDRRVAQNDIKEAHRANTKRILGATVLGALVVFAGVKAVDNSRAQSMETPPLDSGKIGITTVANGHRAEMTISAEDATPAQQYAQVVKENGGNLPGAP